jgi:hypothetical protein
MKRFSLKFLFVITTVLIVFLGYSQSRRRDILWECQLMSNYGVQFVLPNSSFDMVWQRKPSQFVLLVGLNASVNQRREEKMNQSLKNLGIGPIGYPNHAYRFRQWDWDEYRRFGKR